MLFTNEKRGNFAKDPAVVHFQGQYFLYYSIRLQEKPLRIGIGIATSTDREHWSCVAELPMEQDCEKNGVAAPAAIVLEGKVHLFYQTYGNGRSDALCHAVSSDGLHFVKDATNPVFHPTDDWCAGRAIDADVCLFHGKLYLYFATRDHAMRVQKLGCAWADAHADFSRGTWTQAMPQSILAPEMALEGECIEAPATIVNGDRVFLFYGGGYNCFPQQIGCAVSEDGVFFRKLSAQPFYRNGAPGSWNSCESGHPYAFRDDDGKAYLFYQGSADQGKTWRLSSMEIGFDAQNRPFVLSE